ncbi:helix-turn-helix domain-containing protein [Salinirussus salinus]|jgi:predicted DNA binding protein|uniref:helix-turn-helix domain-containing protein n=1 Tax=Salinirussus salinus TaxID=1198300 RepID=UPI001356CAC7|nr:helix-turn-helix domain-containing protein [Salinirussus salinus]
MRYLCVRLEFSPETRHPMHDFLVTHPEMDREELWTWRFVGERPAMLFRVVGPAGPYRERIRDVETVADCTLTPADDDSVWAFVHAEPTSEEWDWILAFARESVVVVPPVVYTDAGSAVFEVLGDPDDLRALLADLPEGIDTTVERVGGYDPRRNPGAALTERQREVVATAVGLGYYDVPREATLEEVADELDIAGSTVSTHLRKAEAAVMGTVVSTRR